MNLYIDNHKFIYETENICRLFFPNSKFKVIKNTKPCESDDEFIYTNITIENDEAIIEAIVKLKGEIKKKYSKVFTYDTDFENECERQVAIILFEILDSFEKIHPPWGIITGIRPVKLMRKLIKERGIQKTIDYFKNVFLVSAEKLNLCYETMGNEQKLIDLSKSNSFSLYISIPFCPTRCTYCSFVSQSIEKAKRLIPEYVELLCKEIKYTAKISNQLNLKLETVYIGGGTPTTLLPDQMFKLLTAIKDSFNLDSCREFTVEAGRPDTVTNEILSVIKSFNVNRISINPQTLNNEILKKIGRKHTANQTIDAFNMARKCGFNNINMDLIAGLPDESYESFANTLNNICQLSPENITVHSLSIKKASKLTENGNEFKLEDSVKTSNMLKFAYYKLKTNNYIPYYLYRQSRIVGNHENVGWAKTNHECLYNVYIMDETHTILACGAGAVTKLKQPGGNYIERIFNYKFPYEYISSFEEMMKRKEKVIEFYEKFQ